MKVVIFWLDAHIIAAAARLILIKMTTVKMVVTHYMSTGTSDQEPKKYIKKRTHQLKDDHAAAALPSAFKVKLKIAAL
jgi:hypothetical protein